MNEDYIYDMDSKLLKCKYDNIKTVAEIFKEHDVIIIDGGFDKGWYELSVRNIENHAGIEYLSYVEGFIPNDFSSLSRAIKSTYEHEVQNHKCLELCKKYDHFSCEFERQAEFREFLECENINDLIKYVNDRYKYLNNILLNSNLSDKDKFWFIHERDDYLNQRYHLKGLKWDLEDINLYENKSKSHDNRNAHTGVKKKSTSNLQSKKRDDGKGKPSGR